MEFVIADKDGRNLRQIVECEVDLAYGDDENDFELTCDPSIAPKEGDIVYCDGTEYGGVVDEVESDTATRLVTARGRTFHGILAGKRLVPDSGKKAVTVSGTAKAVMQSLITRFKLSPMFVAVDGAGGNVSYTFERFGDAYSGIRAMAKAHSLRLSLVYSGGRVEASLVPVRSLGDKVDSDLMDFTVSRIARRTNHLVCGGTGEQENRKVIHFYANADGKVSKKQSLFGVDEIAAFYDYSNADEAELDEEGRKELEGMQTSGSVSISAHDDIEAEVGDYVTATDNVTGTKVTSEIAKKILKVSRGVPTYEYEVGSESLGTSNSTISGTAESSGGGHAYYAGEGLTLNNYTFSADVTEADLNAVSATATNAATLASNASAAAGAAQQAATRAQGTADGKADKSHTHAYLPLTGGTVAGGVLLSNGDKEANFGVVREVDAGKVRGTIKVQDDGTVSFLTKNETTGLYPNQLNLSPTATTLTRPLTLSSGGTGASSAKAARYNLLNGVTDAESTPNDGTVMLFAYQSPTSVGDAVYRNTAGRFWGYIKTKASAVFAAINHTHSYAGSSTAGGAANSAKKWDTPRKITLTGAVNGSATLDGSQDVTITVEGDQAAAGFLAAHPVGSVIETVAGVNPNDVGGTWVQLPSVGLIAWKRTE